MEYQELFVLFWKQVQESVKEGTFAKLTMAKTIGKPELKNIFLRPIYSKDGFTVLLKFRYRLRETQDTEEEYTLDAALDVLKPYLRKSFLCVLLFTTTKDVTFKLNRKGIASITETHPSFRAVVQAEKDVEE
jgi:hypothetical protein